MSLTTAQRKSRYRFDWEVCQRMWNRFVQGEAYRSAADLEARRNPITTGEQAEDATRYRIDFHIPTLTGPGTFAPTTTIGFDLSGRDYPDTEPATWIISGHVPYSPHFMKGAPVCIGRMWRDAKGNILLGHLVIHIARLLNWDEWLTPGYSGWNGAAIAYHKRTYGHSPLNPSIVYPEIPIDMAFGLGSDDGFFTVAAKPLDNPADLFGPSAQPKAEELFR